MKKLGTLLTLVALFLNTSLYAQNTCNDAVKPVTTAKSNNWQNWVFAGSALLTAAGAIFFVSMNNGEKIHNTSH